MPYASSELKLPINLIQLQCNDSDSESARTASDSEIMSVIPGVVMLSPSCDPVVFRELEDLARDEQATSKLII